MFAVCANIYFRYGFPYRGITGRTDMKASQTFVAVLMSLSFLVPGCQQAQRAGGVDSEHEQDFSEIGPVVEEEIEKGSFPGAVVFVGRGDEILCWQAFGAEVIEPFTEPMNRETIFDLASMTKPIATATSILILNDRRALKLDDYVSTYLSSFGCNGKEQTRIRHLLTHTSGLPAYTNANELKEQFGSPCPDELIEKICGLQAASVPGEKFRYSCLGYITLAKIVEVVSGRDIADFSRRNIYARLGMKRTTFNPPGSWQRHIAATEIVEGQLLRGTVHDPLARLMDGVSGNAGLFSDVYDLSIYCRMLLNSGVWKRRRILSPEAVAMLTTEQSHGRAFGFDVSSSYSWVKGDYAPDGAFCHTGYTGTSIVCDPDSGLFVIVLTNRAHPHDKGATKPVRKRIADIVFSSLQSTPVAQ
jgi:CubicO group peptidase (beta-lactamase class C family)